jgi:hypothetical protein
MAIDPNIALGFRPIQIEQRNPLAEYAQIQNIQNAQLQNQLARQQMEQEQGAVNYLGRADLSTPEGRAGLRQFGKTGLGYEQLIAQQESNSLKNKELQGKIREQQMSALGTGLTSVMHDPTDEKLTQAFDRLESTGVDVSKLRDQFSKLPDFASRKSAIQSYVMTHPEGRAALAFVQPKPENFDLNGKIVTLDMNPNSPTYKQQIQEQAKTQSFADKNAAARLAFEKEKFNFEKANPGYELKEDADGNFFGVNKRTLQAVPVTVGGGVPAAAPAVQGAGMPGPRMAQPGAVPAIPGMTSVLDQAAPAAAPATGVRQLTGKGTALTESQGNAAAYGMRMKEANSILAPLEKAGVKNTGLVSNVVGGALGIVPLIGDKLEGVSGSVFNALPQILGGLSPEQQQVAQARINFITAVLRKESGASISPGEFTTAEKNYFPKPGDDASVVAQKQKARELAIKAMGIQAGPGAKNIEQFVPSGGASAPTVSNW